jgi:DNA-binding GntR family transcriptional regulator
MSAVRTDTTQRASLGQAHRELWQVVSEEIRSLIISGEFAPGERLVETALAERFAVSRGPIRTALMELERVGLVTSIPRRGVQVATFEPSDIRELYDVTLALERMAAREAAERISAAQTNRMRELLDALDQAEHEDDSAGTVDADLELHTEFVRASGNRRLLQLWMQLSDQIRFAIAVTRRAAPEVEWLRDSAAIVEAIESGNLDRAEQAVVSCFAPAYAALNALTPEAFDALTGRTSRRRHDSAIGRR